MLTLDQAKAIKYKGHYHIILPVSEGQCEGPTMTLNHIITAIKELRNIIINLKLETLSITKINYINNVLWINITITSH